MANDERSRRAGAALALVGIFGAVAVGCTVEAGGSGDEWASVGQEFSGTITFPPSGSTGACTTTQKTTIRNGAAVAVANLRSSLMRDCLAHHALSATNGDPAEVIWYRLKGDMPTAVTCEALDSPGINVNAQRVNVEGESMRFDTGFLSETVDDPDTLASVLLHEIAHTKGYMHGLEGSMRGEYPYTVSEQVEACSLAISTGTFHPLSEGGFERIPHGTDPFVGTSSNASMLGPVGGEGGSPYDDLCSSGKFVSGLRGYEDDEGIWKLGFSCRSSSGTGTPSTSTQRGASQGSSFDDDCPDGTLLTGVTGLAYRKLRALVGICQDVDEIRARTSEDRTYLDVQGTPDDGEPYSRFCPAGQAVKGILAHAGSGGVYGFTLSCENVDRANEQDMDLQATFGSTDGVKERARCPRYSVMAGLFGATGSEVDRLGGVCHSASDLGDFVTVHSSVAGIVPARGGWAGTDFAKDACDGGSALVGLEIRSGTRINRVRGLCADAWSWSRTGTSAPVSSLDNHGGTGGDLTRVECPRGYFLFGWDIWTDEVNGDDRVTGIRPICMQPES